MIRSLLSWCQLPPGQARRLVANWSNSLITTISQLTHGSFFNSLPLKKRHNVFSDTCMVKDLNNHHDMQGFILEGVTSLSTITIATTRTTVLQGRLHYLLNTSKVLCLGGFSKTTTYLNC